MSKPLARKTDPITSHLAPGSKASRATIADAVLKTLKKYRRGLTDEQLVEVYASITKAPKATPSGIRTRRAELVAAGLVEMVEDREGVTATGRRAKVWRAA